MILYEELQKATSEEDIKDTYIKFLGLKEYSKNLIDIQTKEIWFEAKQGSSNSYYKMFTQLFYYVKEALKTGETLPQFLCVIDASKAAIMSVNVAKDFIENNKKLNWGTNASQASFEAIEAVSQVIGTHFIGFNIQTCENEFKYTIKEALAKGQITRTQITPDNLKSVFDLWSNEIGFEIENLDKKDYALLFFADIMSDGEISTHKNLSAELIHSGGKPAFLLNGKKYEVGNLNKYDKFWQIYDRPPKAEFRNYILERRDSLIALDERMFKGAYYTPLHVVNKAYELLGDTLGKGWQKNYIVWDMCCGVGNLETKHANHKNIFMSTLDKEDIDIMNAAKVCPYSVKFQYDYLNDDIDENGNIDYTITNKMPSELREILELAKSGKKKILVLINPPYGEAGDAHNASSKENLTKAKIADTKVANFLMRNTYGKATNELFTQFIARISAEIPTATIAMFSTLKYVNSTNFETFREVWNSTYKAGFIVHSKAFDGLKGNFPIGFCIWQTNNLANAKKTPITEISCEILDKNALPMGEKKFYNLPNSSFLSSWIKRPRANNKEVIGLKNTVTPNGIGKWCDDAIAHFVCDSNDVQNASIGTALLSSASKIGHKGTIFVTKENLHKVSVVFTVRRLIKPTWINDRDQFLQPNCELDLEFQNDCLIYMLFSGSNLTASADDLEWGGQKYSIVNHFIPFREEELDAPSAFESDFMLKYIKNLKFSIEAKAVLKEAKELWRFYFKSEFPRSIKESLKLNRADVGWYQVRNALKENEKEAGVPVSFSAFENAYKTLADKLRPKVYEYGFLMQ